MKNTCALCGRECFAGRAGLCQNCLKEWTVTGTYPIPDWLKTFSREHQSYDRKKKEMPFSVAFPETGEYDGVYTEVRYEIIEQKHRRIERRGRPHKIVNASKVEIHSNAE